MNQRLRFQLSVFASAIAVFAFGTFTIKSRLANFKQGSIIEGLPVQKAKDSLAEIQSLSASSAEALKEFLEKDNSTSVPPPETVESEAVLTATGSNP